MVAAVVLIAATAGILIRAPGQLAPFWPANAVLLGLMVRHPGLASRPCWMAAMAAHLLAELLAGAAPATAVLAAGANLGGVAAGLLLFGRMPLWARRLRRPAAIVTLVAVIALSAAVTAILAAAAARYLSPGTPQVGLVLRFMREAMSQVAVLPVILAAPLGRPRLLLLSSEAGWLARVLPALAVGASCVAAMEVGGPGAIAFPVPALLWCAMTYGVFGTSVLTLGFTLWSVFVMPPPLVPQLAEAGLHAAMLSVQIAVTLLALAPITVASVIAARDEQLERLRHLSTRDPLTGLLNHRAFHEHAEAHLARQGGPEPAALLMIDLDHFKSINDRHGHAVGDEVLRAFAAIAQCSLRKHDILGRLGGEEFAIFLPDCRPVDARGVAERIRARLAGSRIPLAEGGEVSVTASIGLIAMRRPGAGISPLLQHADRALYRAKAAGRNRVEEHPWT